MAETAGSRMIPTFFAACICPWQYFGMKIRKRKRALGHQVGALFAGQIFLRLWSPGGRDWAHERKYPLPPIARRQCMGFLVIFGQAERKKFEEIRESLPPCRLQAIRRGKTLSRRKMGPVFTDRCDGIGGGRIESRRSDRPRRNSPLRGKVRTGKSAAPCFRQGAALCARASPALRSGAYTAQKVQLDRR